MYAAVTSIYIPAQHSHIPIRRIIITYAVEKLMRN